VTLALNDSPSVAGTPITAVKMNNIETELVTLDTFMNGTSTPGTVTITSTQTWTVPNGVYKIFLRLWGPGGGGAGTGGGAASGAGSGGSGGFICGWLMNVTPGQVITITIGAGGSAGSYSVNGGTGGTTTVGNMSAYGGYGGIANNVASTFTAGGSPGGTSNNADAISKNGNWGNTGTNASNLAGAPGVASIDGSVAGLGGIAMTSASGRLNGAAGSNGQVIINW